MNTPQLRAWAVGLIEAWRDANYASVPAYYENGELPDKDKVGDTWLDVSVRFLESRDITVGVNPRGRDSGVISVMVFRREGEGTALSDEITDSLRTMFRQHRKHDTARLSMPEKTPFTTHFGWHKTGLVVPFTNELE